MDHYRTHSEEFWGYPGRQYAVYGRQSTGPDKRVSDFFKTRAQAEKLCSKMNADWSRYQNALWDARAAAGKTP
jgi:hypothetical protein